MYYLKSISEINGQYMARVKMAYKIFWVFEWKINGFFVKIIAMSVYG
jgi:hypothetical protein